MTDYRKVKPAIGAVCHTSDLGLKGRALRVWSSCPSCHIERWVRTNQKYCRCKQCAARLRIASKKVSGHGSTVQVDGTEPIPGDKVLGSQIGRRGKGYFIWTLCPDCGIGRWVQQRQHCLNSRCFTCANKKRLTGSTNPRWNNGVRYDASHGYYVRVNQDHPFYQMSMNAGGQKYIAEHRLVVAMSIGRTLEKWEVVHHINGDNTDNRLENLELLSSQTKHLPYNILQTEVYALRDRVSNLEKRVTILEADNSLLASQLEDRSIPNQAGDNIPGRRRDLTGDTLQNSAEGEGKVHSFRKLEGTVCSFRGKSLLPRNSAHIGETLAQLCDIRVLGKSRVTPREVVIDPVETETE